MPSAEAPAFHDKVAATYALSAIAILGAIVPKLCAGLGWLGFTGANYSARVYELGLHPAAVLDQPWRWLSHWWVHKPVLYTTDIVHVACTVALLQLLGPALESRYGSGRVLLAFGLGLLAGSLALFGAAPFPGGLGMVAGCCALSGLELGAYLAGRRPKGGDPLWLRLAYLAVCYGLALYLLPMHAKLPGLAPLADVAGLLGGVLLGLVFEGKPKALPALLLVPLLAFAGWRATQVRALFPAAPAEAERYEQLRFPAEATAAKQAAAERRLLLESDAPPADFHQRSLAVNAALRTSLDTLVSVSQRYGEAGRLHQRLQADLQLEEAVGQLDDLRGRIEAINDPTVRIEVHLAQDFWDVLFVDFVAFLRLEAADYAIQRLDVRLVGKLYGLVKAKASPATLTVQGLQALEARQGFP